MPKWTVVFFPPSGESDSPYDCILGLSNNAEAAQILHRLSALSELDLTDWPHSWIHKISGKIYQLTAGNNRVLYCLDEKQIVVLHVCRKVKRKTLSKDISRAETHYYEYITQKERKRDG
jgi:phage-related protein